MLYIEIRTQNKAIGRIEVRNLTSTFRGKTRYAVRYVLPNGIIIETTVLHHREDGAIKLLTAVSRGIQKEMDVFFSIPQDKVVNGAIKCKDIPQRYVKAFSEFSPVNTGTIIDGETALFVTDIETWLRMMKTGVSPVWD